MGWCQPCFPACVRSLPCDQVSVGRGSARVLGLLLGLSFGLTACAADDEVTGDASTAQCLEPQTQDCVPSFEPADYNTIYEEVLRTSCGIGGAQCHGKAGAKAGLSFADRDEAYDHLLGKSGGRALVIPDDPECSILQQRLESDDADFRMPRGNEPLDEGLRCAVRLWIANGAKR